MAKDKYKILIDGRFIGVGDSMTRYTLEILKHILEVDKTNDYTVLIRPQGNKEIKKLQTAPVSAEARSEVGNCKLQTEVQDIPHYSFSEQTKLLKWLKSKNYDLVHFIQFNHPTRYRGKFVVTVHDLTLLGHLYRKDWLRRLGFAQVMKSAVNNSAKIITISKTSKQDLIDIYKVKTDKIAVTHLAVDKKFNIKAKQPERIEQFKTKYGIKGDYILYTGMWKRHKNLLRMLKAFEKYEIQNPKSKIQLVLVGKIDKDEPEVMALINQINQRISKSKFQIPNKVPMLRSGSRHKVVETNQANEVNEVNEANKAIITTGFIDESELPTAYAGALAYCIPSLSEGFGLPPLEAMACGTPVISSNISAMPEILGKAPLYFDPYDVADIADKMKKVICDKKLRLELTKKGLAQVKRYSWKDTAKKTLNVYKEVLNK